jgi:SAM-dependent methyltransferase
MTESIHVQKYNECWNYCIELEKRLQSDSDKLEEIHMEAAIDAATTDIHDDDDHQGNHQKQNPNSVENCLSPYVPTTARKIVNVFEFIGFISPTCGNDDDTNNIHAFNSIRNDNNVLLDIGCGDGRVCIVSVSKVLENNITRAIGIDISPCCINNARRIAHEESLYPSRCTFYQFDVTKWSELAFIKNMTPLTKNNDSCIKDIDDENNLRLLQDLQADVTIIFLYTYPTLLLKLIPILSWLFRFGNLRGVVSLTYHIPDKYNATINKYDPTSDLKLYTNIPV